MIAALSKHGTAHGQVLSLNTILAAGLRAFRTAKKDETDLDWDASVGTSIEAKAAANDDGF